MCKFLLLTHSYCTRCFTTIYFLTLIQSCMYVQLNDPNNVAVFLILFCGKSILSLFVCGIGEQALLQFVTELWMFKASDFKMSLFHNRVNQFAFQDLECTRILFLSHIPFWKKRRKERKSYNGMDVIFRSQNLHNNVLHLKSRTFFNICTWTKLQVSEFLLTGASFWEI